MSYSKILEEIIRLEKNGENLKSLKDMVIDFIVKEEILKNNKSNKTSKLQKLILAYLKKVDNTRPILQKVKITDDGKYWFTNGFSAIELKSDLKIEGLPLVSENDGEYINLDKIFLKTHDIINEDINKEVLYGKVALYKSVKKGNRKNASLDKKDEEIYYKIENKYFNPVLLKEAIDIIGEPTEIRAANNSPISLIEIHAINGRAVIMPVRIDKD